MLMNLGKRCFSFLLALIMVFSMVPVQAFAVEEVHDHALEEHEELTSIAVTTLPAKTEYVQGESLDVAGGVITLYYGDHGHETDMTEDMVSGYDADTVGKQTLTVTYEGLTDTFDVTVKAAPAPWRRWTPSAARWASPPKIMRTAA